MPRAQGFKQLLSPQEGLVTEQSPLTPVEGSTISEVNFEFSQDSSYRLRRKGINKEMGATFLTFGETLSATSATAYHRWDSVNNDGSLTFHVFQINNLLYFLEDAEGNLSGNFKSFSYDLDNDLTSGYVDSSDMAVSMASGDGRLFVVGKKIEPIFIEYDPVGDSISSSQVDIHIRDFTGLDDTLGTNERPATLSEEHEYNLKNQGWNQTRRVTHAGGFVSPITQFDTDNGAFPSNSDIAYLGMIDDGSGNLVFDADSMRDLSIGNTSAPKGHFIIDPFNIQYDDLRTGVLAGNGGYGGATGSGGGVTGGGTTPDPGWWQPPPEYDIE